MWLAQEIKDAFNEKAKKSSTPDEQYITWGNRKLSPKEIAQEVSDETDLGKGVIYSIQKGVAQFYMSVEDCVEQVLYRPPAP
jgi:hypothetical protein